MDELRIGLVGFGRFGRIHMEEISNTKEGRIVCVCIGSEKSSFEARKELDIPVYSDYEEMLAKEEVDIVDIVSPNYLHASQAAAAMKASKDVILEKPIAINMREASELLSVQKQTKSKVQVVFENRYDPFWKSFKQVMQEDSTFAPRFAKLESWRGPLRQGSQNWRYDQSKVGHQLFEEAIHYFDSALWYFGKPDSVWGITNSRSSWSEGKLSSAAVFLDYEKKNLTVMILDTLTGVGGHYSVSISGELGGMYGALHSGLKAETWYALHQSDDSSKFETVEMPSEGETLRLLLQDCLRNFKEGKDPAINLQDGFDALSLASSAISAIETGEKVRSIFLPVENN